MAQKLNVYALPKLIDPREFNGGTVVVLDVLLASTTILYALEAGATEVIPCGEIEDARQAALRFRSGDCVLGGERRGLRIDGFELGYSPAEYTPQSVGGKAVILTTSNGTRAMFHARTARRVLVGAFVNATAIFQQLLGEEQIHLLCAGTDGEVSRDDVLLAGLLVERLVRHGGMNYQQNAQAITAREVWMKAFALPYALGAEPLEPERLAEQLYDSPAGKHLAALGLDEDILAAAEIDHYPHAAELDREEFHVRLV